MLFGRGGSFQNYIYIKKLEIGSVFAVVLWHIKPAEKWEGQSAVKINFLIRKVEGCKDANWAACLLDMWVEMTWGFPKPFGCYTLWESILAVQFADGTCQHYPTHQTTPTYPQHIFSGWNIPGGVTVVSGLRAQVNLSSLPPQHQHPYLPHRLHFQPHPYAS